MNISRHRKSLLSALAFFSILAGIVVLGICRVSVYDQQAPKLLVETIMN